MTDQNLDCKSNHPSEAFVAYWVELTLCQEATRYLPDLPTGPAVQHIMLFLQILVALDLAACIAFLKNIEPT